MKQTYVLTQISKLNQSELTIDEYNEKANAWVKQITVYDHPEFLKRNKPPELKEERAEAGLDEEVEYFNGSESTDFSLENWNRFKEGLPSKLPIVFLPKRLDGRNSITVYNRKIYIVKKNVNLTPTTIFCAFDARTGIQLCTAWKKKDIEPFLIENMLDKMNIIKQED